MFYLTKIIEIGFKSSALNLRYQRFSYSQMTLRKRTIDNSVKNIHSANSSPNQNSHDHKLKTASIPRRRNKKFSQKNKISLKIK